MRHAKTGPGTLTDAEVDKLLRETGRSDEDLRDHILFSVALGTGLRISELVALDVRDVKNGKGVKGVVPLRPEITKRHSGGEIVLPERLRRKLVRYIAWKREYGESLAPKAPLFCSRGGGRSGAKGGSRLADRSARAAFTAWQERLGFDRKVTFHELRHSFATNLWRATGDLRLVQRAVRHSSPATTAIYTHPTTQDVLKAVQRLPC